MNQQLTEIEFSPYPKTPRLFGNKNIIVTEKLDGTNAAIQIIPESQLQSKEWDADDEEWYSYWNNENDKHKITAQEHDCVLVAQSRNRIITPKSDNFGFAQWVWANSLELVETLGTGIHRGEWYGSGIQRGYGLKDKRFALFAIDRYKDSDLTKVPGLGLVPELYRGRFDTEHIDWIVNELRKSGSRAVTGFKAEGVVVYHEASREVFKVMCEMDELAKGEQ